MVDVNGKSVSVGDRIVLLSGRERGSFGYIRRVGFFPGRDRTPAVMAADCRADVDITESDAWSWCSWLKSREFALVAPE